MKLIGQSFDIYDQGVEMIFPDDLGHEKEAFIKRMKKHIERCGRTCYKSEDKTTDTSYEGFVHRMIQSKHTSMLEHGTVYLYAPFIEGTQMSPLSHYHDNKYSKCNQDDKGEYVTTNYRVIIENEWENDFQYICEPKLYLHERRYTVHLTTNIHVYKDLTRHRPMSYAIESTRYCNYSKDKFGSELTFIKPCWDCDAPAFQSALKKIEDSYIYLTENGWKAQEAATILPQATKADVIITGFISDWKHIFDLRVLGITGAPHPQVHEIMSQVMEEFIKRGYLE